ncbi:PAS domain-containing protein [Paucibacter sp. R3-3]|uniref:histidine kinase n=1 Tax=Roseateles agri TaxID=3098619 RepID=A0ABU5DRT0_9BURK|nr:PAS domain-containing protein [Paucibacter sp. R3-3]MDY0749027.1 PAS domain-containing protein [Paucibacter sp. R3-3]
MKLREMQIACSAMHCPSLQITATALKIPEALKSPVRANKREASECGSHSGSHSGEMLDLATIVQVSEAISREINLERLIEVLLTLSLEQTGAERASLFLNGDKGLQLVASAELSAKRAILSRAERTCLDAALPAPVIELLERSQHAELAAEGTEGRTGSTLCVPLIRQARLAGIIYLETESIAGVFTGQSAAVLKFIASQASIALENSRLYLDLVREKNERKTAEETIQCTAQTLAESEERFRAMANSTSDVIWISEANPERLLYVNPSFEKVWGISVAALHENVHLRIEGIHPEDRQRVLQAFIKWTSSDESDAWEMEFRVLQPSGAVRWMHERGVFLSGKNENPRRIGGIATDITEQREAIWALRQSEQRYTLAMEAARDGHWDWIAATDTFYASPRLLEIYGFPPETRFKGRQDFLDRFPFHPDDKAHWLSEIKRFFDSQETRIEIGLRLIRQGEVRSIHTNGLLSRDSQGRPIRYTGSVSDITERRAAEDALRESEQRFSLATEGSSDGIYDWDLISNAMFISHRCQELFGLTPCGEIRQRQDWISEVSLHPDDVAPQRKMFRDLLDGKIPTYDKEWRVLHPDGTYRWVRVRGVCKRDLTNRAIRFAGSVTDVDARRRTEAAMQQMQRLEAVGTLAGGVAHDFNNILAVILGFGEASMRHTRRGSRMRRDLERILSAGERGRALVERILAFSRSSVGARVVVDVQGVVAESLAMVEATCPPYVRLVAKLNSCGTTIVGDPTQIHQLVMNLATNGVQAMTSAGTLKTELHDVSISKNQMTTTGPLPEGEYVVLSVRDSGSGIDPAIREKIFDPFFTTKDVGTGTGLGLSLVHGIVADLGGAIELTTEVGAGSCFSVYLPQGGSAAREREEEAQPPIARGREERILLVDDEEALVRLASDMLTELGYQAAGFTSSARALEAFDRDPGAFAAVITDSRMPHMSGVRLIRALRERRSDTPIVLASGFLSTAGLAEARAAGANVILNKPVSRRALAQALSEALKSSAQLRASAD